MSSLFLPPSPPAPLTCDHRTKDITLFERGTHQKQAHGLDGATFRFWEYSQGTLVLVHPPPKTDFVDTPLAGERRRMNRT